MTGPRTLTKRCWTVVGAGMACVLAVGVFRAAPAGAMASARGTVSMFAPVGSPYFPALPHVVAYHVFEGTYDNPTGDEEPSKVFEYSTAGVLLRTFVVNGQDLSQPHGVQVAANDARGRLLLLDRTRGRIIRLDPQTGAQTLYSQVPNLPLCSAVTAGTSCSQALLDQAPMPDYAAWGPDGSLYVTDYQQAVIWRIPPGGGQARIWLSSRLLDGGPFGTACIAMMPDHHTLLFDQASNGGLSDLSPTQGKLYTVAIGPGGRPGTPHQVWQSGPADAPDGCALARSGHIYVALVGIANQVVELSSSGQQLARFGQQYTGDDGSPVPFDSPSGVAFLGTQLLIANQSYFADDHSNQVLLDLATGELGQPVFVPADAGQMPVKPRPKHHRRRRRHKPTAGHNKGGHNKHPHNKHRHTKHRTSSTSASVAGSASHGGSSRRGSRGPS
jgi:sugar lactone lactonase YvrE